MQQLSSIFDPRSPPAAEIYWLSVLILAICAALRARILQADLQAIGIALKSGLVTPDQALALLHDVDALRYVGTPPDDKC